MGLRLAFEIYAGILVLVSSVAFFVLYKRIFINRPYLLLKLSIVSDCRSFRLYSLKMTRIGQYLSLATSTD